MGGCDGSAGGRGREGEGEKLEGRDRKGCGREIIRERREKGMAWLDMACDGKEIGVEIPSSG